MSKEMVISVNPHETRVAILEEGQLCEYYVEREKEFALVGSIYKGRVTRVLPGMQSAFVEIGLDSDAFLYVSDFLEDIEDLDSVVTTTEEKIHKVEEQGGNAFPEKQTASAVEPMDVEPVTAAEAAIEPGNQAAEASEPSAGHLEALPGESFSPAAPGSRSAEPTGGYSRPRFGDRDRNRGNGRFDRRGGRGGRGRFGRGGRGRDRDRGDDRSRHGSGRDLPQSKYARPYEDHSAHASEAAPPSPEGYARTILPGESLAKYKERPPSEAMPPPGHQAAESPATLANYAEHTLGDQSAAVENAPAHLDLPPSLSSEARSETRVEQPVSLPRRSSSGFEPLPGESISKWRSAPGPAREPVAFIPPTEESDAEEDIEESDAEEAAIEELDEPADPEEVAAELAEAAEQARDIVAELSEEEAASLAQHVAETQIEQGTVDLHDEPAREAEDEEDEDDELASFAEAAPAAELAAHAGDGESVEPGEPDDEAEVRKSLLAFDTGDDNADLAEPDGNRENQPPARASMRGDFRARMHHPARRGGRDRDRGGRDRGRRPHQRQGGGPHHHQGHGQHRGGRPQLISDMLKQGQEIIVQIAKEPLGKKGARITSHIALPGRYLVYMPTLHHTGVSRKIASAEERSRLRHLVNDAKGAAGGGFIVRTAAASAPPEDVRTDVEFLTKTWAEIKSRSEQRKAPSLLHRDLNLVERILRDFVNNDFGAIWVDCEEEYTKVVDFMSRFQPALVSRVKLYTKDNPVFEEFGIQQEVDKGLRPKVWLKSGGYIVINHTEALVAIDVNTGKFVGKGSTRLEDTIVKTNLEAVKEIVRQMRLRDLGGIIVIDFIDMEERRNREKVMAALEDALRADRAPSKVLRFNEFGLVAITRKRTKQALERTLCQPCPYCTGSGMVKSIPTLCYEIQAEAKKMAPEMDSGSLTLRVHPEISKALKTRESALIEELERWTKKSVIIQADPSLHWEQYDIY